MPSFAVVDDKVIVNVIVAESQHIAETLTGKECIETNEDIKIGIRWYWLDDFAKYVNPAPYDNWIYDGEKWVPPIPYPTIEEGSEELYSWDQDSNSWLLLPPSN